MHANDSARSNGTKNGRSSARTTTGRAATPLLALQRSAGNAAVVQMLRRGGHPWAQEEHRHSADCGHQQAGQPVQRSTVPDVLRSPGRPLDDNTRTEMEARLGADFSDVRLHTDTAAQVSAAQVGARAYTSGSHVVIGDGGADKHTLAHELTHVIQQRKGPVTGTDNGSGLKISDPSDRFEREAEANARRAMSGSAPVQRTTVPTAGRPAHQSSPVLARMPAEGADAEVKPWLVFGVDGRSREQLTSAVAAGYRRFDTAESYGNIETVAEVLSGRPRDSYEVLYKFDVRSGESAAMLRARLEGIGELFGGRLDSLLIHNLDADHRVLADAWQVLNELKSAGRTGQIGLGNIGENHAALLSELGGVDVVENSVESVLLNRTVENAIKESGAHLYYYDVIRTAQQMDLDLSSPNDLNGLIYTMAGIFPRADGTSNSTMISSSGSSGRQAANLQDFGGGPDHEDFTGDEQYDAMEKIDRWRKQQSAGQENDTSFALRTELRTWLVSLCEGDAANALRSSIDEAAKRESRLVDQAFIREWLLGQGHVTADDLTSVRVPSRVGLKRRYIGMPLQDTLAALFGTKNCDWKWSIQLVQLMFSGAEAWDSFLRFGADEIVQQ
ncbi:aldo/keto reductase [Streptomyces abyssomicinicus]|uniref:aldo/keto reductase n=1 Tax=Streptomyces abyssomicinicus TaxID=574929 RepID=UPI00124F846A|nr:aldo/keto reductase [Streptomyces abyssomicinicus]